MNVYLPVSTNGSSYVYVSMPTDKEFVHLFVPTRSQDSAVGIVTRLWDGYCAVWIQAGTGGFSLLPNIQTSSGVHPASYSMGVPGSCIGVQVPGVWSWPPTSIWCWGAITLLPLNVFMAWTGTNFCFYFVPLCRTFCSLCSGELKQLSKLCSYSAAVTTVPLTVYMSACIISSSICSTMTTFGVFNIIELHIYLFMYTAIDSSN